MKYFVELSDNVIDLTLGRLYPVENNCVYDDRGDAPPVSLLEDRTGYRVEL